MTETDAVTIATQDALDHQLQPVGVRHAVFVTSDDPLRPASHDRAIWFVYFDLGPEVRTSLIDCFLIEVDDATGEATLQLSL